MPPRSVCLNVFTTSLGNDIGLQKEQEVDVEVREVEDKMEGVEHVTERARHDSVQGSLNDAVATSPHNESTIAPEFTPSISTADIDSTTFSNANTQGSKPSPKWGQDQVPYPERNMTLPTTCSTCAEPPALGVSLSRCSRCKNAFYCSKACQKAAWKLHKYECVPTGALHGLFPSSVTHTPDISNPASPVTRDLLAEDPAHGMDVSSTETLQY